MLPFEDLKLLKIGLFSHEEIPAYKTLIFFFWLFHLKIDTWNVQKNKGLWLNPSKKSPFSTCCFAESVSQGWRSHPTFNLVNVHWKWNIKVWLKYIFLANIFGHYQRRIECMDFVSIESEEGSQKLGVKDIYWKHGEVTPIYP